MIVTDDNKIKAYMVRVSKNPKKRAGVITKIQYEPNNTAALGAFLDWYRQVSLPNKHDVHISMRRFEVDAVWQHIDGKQGLELFCPKHKGALIIPEDSELLKQTMYAIGYVADRLRGLGLDTRLEQLDIAGTSDIKFKVKCLIIHGLKNEHEQLEQLIDGIRIKNRESDKTQRVELGAFDKLRMKLEKDMQETLGESSIRGSGRITLSDWESLKQDKLKGKFFGVNNML